jgi:mannosyltransferase
MTAHRSPKSNDSPYVAELPLNDRYVARAGKLQEIQWRLVAVITLLAATLDLFRISAQPVWLDEAVSIWLARMNLPDFFSAITKNDTAMFLYDFLLRIPLAFGQSEFAVRSLSTIFAVAAVPSSYLLGRRLFDNRTAALAAILLAVNSLFIEYAQEARSYTLTTLIAIWSWYTLLDLVDRPGWVKALYYSLVTGALAYCHFLSLLVLPAQLAALYALRPGGRLLKVVAYSIFMIAILSLPMAFMLWQVRGTADWITRPNVVMALHQLAVRFINLPRRIGPLPHMVVLLSVITLVPLALPILGVASGLRGMERNKLFGYFCAGFGAILPVVGLLTASFLIKPLYVMRYVVPSLPFFLLLLAAGLCELRPALMKVGLGLLVAANVLGTLEYYRVPTKTDWREAIEYLVSRIRPDDKVAIVPGYDRYAFDYNLSRLDRSLPKAMVVFPEERDSIAYDLSTSVMSTPHVVRYSRLWIISAGPPPHDAKVLNAVIETLDELYPYRYKTDFRGISVTLYMCRSCRGWNNSATGRSITSSLSPNRSATR